MNDIDLHNALIRPFPEKRVHWRLGQTNQKKIARDTGNQKAKPTKGRVLAYIDARDVQKRLDDVFGVMGWSATYPRDGYCEITVVDPDGRIVTKGNFGSESNVEAEKGKASDAFKRAAVLFGVGRYLYSLDSPWVDILDDWGKFNPPPLPKWATPSGFDELTTKQEQK